MSLFKISVIIPVYNGFPFLSKAVDSALKQKEVGEIVLVDDGSIDSSFTLCRNYASKYSFIKTIQHEDKKNHGVGATRTLGVKNATLPFITFLDADDYYVVNRFIKTRKSFEGNPKADGVYEAIQRVVPSNLVKKKYQVIQKTLSIITFKPDTKSSDMFESFFLGEKGWFSLDGLTIRKEVFDKVGYFDPNLRQAEDTDFILRVLEQCSLVPGEIKDPVVMSVIHGRNRTLMLNERFDNRHYLFEKWLKKMIQSGWSTRLNWHIVRGYLYSHPIIRKVEKFEILRLAFKIFFFLGLIFSSPILFCRLFYNKRK